jgi:hypothetical protein
LIRQDKGGSKPRYYIMPPHLIQGCEGFVAPPLAQAEDLYTVGVHESDPLLRIRLIAIGREVSREPNTMLPQVTQLVWNDILAFIWRRFKQYKGQKRDVNQWNEPGKRIKRLADDSTDEDTFVLEAMNCMGVNPP